MTLQELAWMVLVFCYGCILGSVFTLLVLVFKAPPPSRKHGKEEGVK